jgi:hypothetical protein
MQADKVYLVSYRPNDAASRYLKMIKDELSEKYKHIQIENVYVDIWDLYDSIAKFREIITKEKENQVFINVSTGTKITAIAGMMACMTWGALPYYASVSYKHSRKIEEYETEIVEEADFLPVYGMVKPNPNILLILDLLQKNAEKMRKARIIDALKKEGVIKIRDESKSTLTKAAEHSQLRAILDPMEKQWNFIKVDSRGRVSEVTLTEKGKAALKIFGV